MYVFVALWRARPSWWALSAEQREEFMEAVGPGVGELAEQGIEAVSWSRNDPETDERAPYDYFAVWRMPSRRHAELLEVAIHEFGWYGYMDQVNLHGAAAEAAEIAAQQLREGPEGPG